MQVSEKDVKVILAKANAGVPLKVIEIHRLAAASGVEVPKPRRFRQLVQETEDKLTELLRAVLDDVQCFYGRSLKACKAKLGIVDAVPVVKQTQRNLFGGDE